MGLYQTAFANQVDLKPIMKPWGAPGGGTSGGSLTIEYLALFFPCQFCDLNTTGTAVLILQNFARHFDEHSRRSSCWAALLRQRFATQKTRKPDLAWKFMHRAFRNVQLIQIVTRIASREMLREKDTIPLLSFSLSRRADP